MPVIGGKSLAHLARGAQDVLDRAQYAVLFLEPEECIEHALEEGAVCLCWSEHLEFDTDACQRLDLVVMHFIDIE